MIADCTVTRQLVATRMHYDEIVELLLGPILEFDHSGLASARPR